MDEQKIKLILRAQNGDKDALVRLIKSEQANIYSTLFYLKKDENDINDIAQNVLIKLSKNIKQLKNPKHFKTWLNQIIIRSYYDYIRKVKKNPKILNLDKDDMTVIIADDSASNPQVSVLNNELDLIIKTSIENLPIHYRIPITLREIQGLSYDEISNVTNTSIGTVKSRIARARAMIKDEIERYSKS